MVLILAALPFSMPPGIPAFVFDRLLTMWIAASSAVAIVAACVGFGTLIVPGSLLRRDPVFALLLAFGCGAGMLSCVVLVAGIVPGLGMSRSLGWQVVIFGIVIGAFRLFPFQRGRQPREAVPSPGFNPIAVASLLLLVVAIGLLAVTAFAPPLLFDVTEYHLGAFRDNFSIPKGVQFRPVLQWSPVPHNFYGRFPFPIESTYWLGLVLSPPLDFAPKLINAAFVIACALLVALSLRRAAVPRSLQLLGALLVAAHPVMRDVSLDAYIDAASAFLVTAALFAAIALDISELLVACLLFGTALASKYTVAQLYLAPFLLLLVFTHGGEWRRLPAKRVRRLMVCGVTGLLPLFFWLGKNVVFYGNPLEPFFNWLFRPNNAAAIAREKFYIASHYPQPIWTTQYWINLLPRLREFGWIFLPLAIAAPVLCRGAGQCNGTKADRSPAMLLAIIAISYLTWNLVRESQNRFLLPDILLLIYLAVFAIERLPHPCIRCFVTVALLVWSGLQLVHQGLTVAGAGEFAYLRDFDTATAAPAAEPFERPQAGLTARDQFYVRNLGALGEILPAVRALPQNARVLLVYEARPYLFPRDVVYNTVWDDSELLRIANGAKNANEVAQKLRAEGITHVLVNRQELRRYVQQYATREQLRALSVRRDEDAANAFYATRTPEDLFPPFYRSAEWASDRGAVIEFLAQMRGRATSVAGKAPLDIYLAPM